MKEDTQAKIQDLQLFEQNLSNLASQKQQFQSQLFEIESALSEIQKTNISYKLIGNVMVKTERADLNKDLIEKQEIIALRVKSLEKQEMTLSEKAKELQKEVMEELKNGKAN